MFFFTKYEKVKEYKGMQMVEKIIKKPIFISTDLDICHFSSVLFISHRYIIKLFESVERSGEKQ